jgi:toxin ParE1/3/4
MTEKYKLLPEAEKDLEKIWKYTVQEWGTEQAVIYIDQMNEGFQLLADNPLLSREYDEFNPPVHIHHHKKHLIVYLIYEAYILIIRVLHESMYIESQLNS